MKQWLLRILNLALILCVLVNYQRYALARAAVVEEYNQQAAEAAALAAEYAAEEAEAEAASLYADGTYQGTGMGFGGEITVEVTVRMRTTPIWNRQKKCWKKSLPPKVLTLTQSAAQPSPLRASERRQPMHWRTHNETKAKSKKSRPYPAKASGMGKDWGTDCVFPCRTVYLLLCLFRH
jgi:hypothetical protein